VGSSEEALAAGSCPLSPPLAAPFSAGASPFSAIAAGFSFTGAGVPVRDGSSDSSSITKAVSNSAGSGPLPPVPSSSLGRGFPGFLAGDSFAGRREDVEADLTVGAPVAF
jgi:hypothetical protein